jgi:hypothetical protein
MTTLSLFSLIIHRCHHHCHLTCSTHYPVKILSPALKLLGPFWRRFRSQHRSRRGGDQRAYLVPPMFFLFATMQEAPGHIFVAAERVADEISSLNSSLRSRSKSCRTKNSSDATIRSERIVLGMVGAVVYYTFRYFAWLYYSQT